MNKICTDIEQSRKLLKLRLDKNTADMHYFSDGYNPMELRVGYDRLTAKLYRGTKYDYIPAWSLTALLKLMPSRIDGFYTKLTKLHDNNGWCIEGHEKVGEPVDAAFGMVVWLIEKGYMMTI